MEVGSNSIGTTGAPAARPYKSKRHRPCDTCRKRRAACKLEGSPPCSMCRLLAQPCTFVNGPALRRRDNSSNIYNNPVENATATVTASAVTDTTGTMDWGDGTAIAPASLGQAGGDDHDPLLHMVAGQNPWSAMVDMADASPGQTAFRDATTSILFGDPSLDSGLPTAATAPIRGDRFQSLNDMALYDFGLDPAVQPSPSPQSGGSSAAISHSPVTDDRPASINITTVVPTRSSSYVGLSCDTDPFMMANLNYNASGEYPIRLIAYQQWQQASPPGAATFPVQMITMHETMGRQLMKATAVGESRSHANLAAIVSDTDGARLIKMFFRFVYPYFPVLDQDHTMDLVNKNRLREIPVCLLAAIYATALPFTMYADMIDMPIYDTPRQEELLWTLCWDEIQRELHFPRIPVLQACLLLLQRRPSSGSGATTGTHLLPESAFKWSLLGATVSLAQTLGLHVDPTTWPMEAWEVRLRRRLWWATYVEDKWQALTLGRPGHVRLEDQTLLMPVPGDGTLGGDGDDMLFFEYLLTLTHIVDEILRVFYSLASVGTLTADFALSVEKAQSLRAALLDWHSSLPAALSMTASEPASSHQINGNGSLHLAYYTADMTIVRALLRALDAADMSEAGRACRGDAMVCGHAVLNVVQQLSWRHFRAFWHAWSRTNFSIATHYIHHLFLSAPSLWEAREAKALVDKWRMVLQAESGSFDMLGLAMLRLNTIQWGPTERMFRVSDHVEQVLKESRGDL